MSVAVCIPARLKSLRFPNKILADLGGKTVLQRVFERAGTIPGIGKIFVLCDSEIVHEAAENFGAWVIDTDENCVSGTERIASALDKIDGDFIVNIQGDEPFFDVAVIGKMTSKALISNADIFTPVYRLDDMRDALDQNCVKVALGYDGRALYFSRSVIPFVRDEKDVQKWLNHAELYGHVGIYGYRRDVLGKYHSLVKGKLEFIEKLEQLRFLENGYVIDTVETAHRSIGIDTPEDLARANTLIADRHSHFYGI